jgi:septal ring factor EnvC (AmiA/AmiB activator)
MDQLRAELARFTKAYDDEVTGRRKEVSACHAEMGRLRADLARVTAERDNAQRRNVADERVVKHLQGELSAARAETERLRERVEAILSSSGVSAERADDAGRLARDIRKVLTSDPEPTT